MTRHFIPSEIYRTNVTPPLGVSEVHRLKQLEDENSRLKRMVADLSLDKQMLQEVLRHIKSLI